MGFPSNQFMNQEKNPENMIKEFVKKFGVDF